MGILANIFTKPPAPAKTPIYDAIKAKLPTTRKTPILDALKNAKVNTTNAINQWKVGQEEKLSGDTGQEWLKSGMGSLWQNTTDWGQDWTQRQNTNTNTGTNAGTGGATTTPQVTQPETQNIIGTRNQLEETLPTVRDQIVAPTPQAAPSDPMSYYNSIPDALKQMGGYEDFFRKMTQGGFLGPEAEQAYGDTLEAQIKEGYARQREDLMKNLEQFGSQRGAFHSGALKDIAAQELQKLGETEQRDINEMRQELAYTGIQRELQRQEQMLGAAQSWANADIQQKGQLMDNMTRGYEAEIDKWFKSGTLDMDKFKTMVEQNLGLSKLDLERSGQANALLATLLDYKLQTARTELERDLVANQIKQMGAQLSMQERQGVADFMNNLYGMIAPRLGG